MTAGIPTGGLRVSAAHEVPWALVLAGGDGVRLRELTRRIVGTPIPKQYCRITGDQSLLQMTLSRIGPSVPASRTIVIVNRDHLALARPQLAGFPRRNVVVQPANRDTGPGVLLGLSHLYRRDSRAIVVLLPSDHYVHDEVAFRRYVEHARDVVRLHPHRIALLGIPPDRPEPGYGYVTTRPVEDVKCPSTFGVQAFEEKPSAEAAARLVADGALWSSLVLVFRVDRMLELLKRILPAAVAGLRVRAGLPLARVYRSIPPWNLSRDFLAHVPQHLVVVRAAGIGWSDLGTPESVERTLAALGRDVPRRSDRRRIGAKASTCREAATCDEVA
jgi:mannose-1-phosphate guanylyltransferase